MNQIRLEEKKEYIKEEIKEDKKEEEIKEKEKNHGFLFTPKKHKRRSFFD